MMVILRCITFLMLVFTLSETNLVDHSPRSLVITNGGIIKLIVGMAMPVELPVSLVWVQNFQFQYSMIDNATQLTQLNLLRKARNFALTRNLAYKIIAQIWDRFEVNGTACVLRTICEMSRLPQIQRSLLGSVLVTIFTPHQTTDSIYSSVSAKISNEKCGHYRSNCGEKLSTLYSRVIRKMGIAAKNGRISDV